MQRISSGLTDFAEFRGKHVSLQTCEFRKILQDSHFIEQQWATAPVDSDHLEKDIEQTNTEF